MIDFIKMKFNLITHITTSCNYNCSYCDVIKDKKNFSKKALEELLVFIKNNKNYIERFKFFGWEPLLAWENIKYIIDNSKIYICNNYEIVTNTSLLKDEIWEYFKKYFKIIFFSIDSENKFDYEKISNFIKKYNLENKVYFNLVISPWNEKQALDQFYRLYNLWFRWFNILPIYLTKSWNKQNLQELSKIMKEILDLLLEGNNLKLYWFQENLWEELKLANNTIFIDIDWKIYYSDIVSTFSGEKIKKDLFVSNINNFELKKLEKNDFKKQKEIIRKLEEDIYNRVSGQKELQKIMDYFSVYLNNKKW